MHVSLSFSPYWNDFHGSVEAALEPHSVGSTVLKLLSATNTSYPCERIANLYRLSSTGDCLRSQNYLARQVRAFIIKARNETRRWISFSEETRKIRRTGTQIVARVHRHVSRAMTRDKFDRANDDISLRATDRVTMYGETAERCVLQRGCRWNLYKNWDINDRFGRIKYAVIKYQNKQNSFYRHNIFRTCNILR